MSKNTASNAFRKIDVDAFNEDNFRDEDAAANAAGASEQNTSEAQVRAVWLSSVT